MKDRSLIDKINPTFIALSGTAIHRCLSARTIGVLRVLPEFGLGGETQRKCDTGNINHPVNAECTDVFDCFDVDFYSTSPEVPAHKIDNIRSSIWRRIHWTGVDTSLAQCHNDQGRFDEDFLDYVPEEPLE